MAAFPGRPVSRYLATDGWTMATYGANITSAYNPVRRLDEPVATVGAWRGRRHQIFFINIFDEEQGEEFEKKFSPVLRLANQSEDTSSDDLFMVYVNIIRFICPGKDNEIRAIFQSKDYEIINLDEIGTKILYHDLNLKIRSLTDEQINVLVLNAEQAANLRKSQAQNDQAIASGDLEQADDEKTIPLT